MPSPAKNSKQVAKLVMIDADGQYLLLTRHDHPRFGHDADLPGGTTEAGETILQTLLREVIEETGVDVSGDQPKQIYDSDRYSPIGTHYYLFVAHLNVRPNIVLSWEHSQQSWVSRTDFLAAAHCAQDDFMHMVYDAMRSR
ncbi:MAG: NUDIX hydrolase [Candidatus Saccharimonadales bacterium]